MTPEVTLYTDGAASPNPGAGGYGVVLVRDGQRRELSGGFRKTTNNRMELMGPIVGLDALGGEPCNVTIVSDSTYVVNNLNGGYAVRWKRAGWTLSNGRQPALNSDLWEELLTAVARHTVTFVWVKGHAEHKENARCDELAVAARRGDALPADEGYEKPVAIATPQMDLFDSRPQ